MDQDEGDGDGNGGEAARHGLLALPASRDDRADLPAAAETPAIVTVEDHLVTNGLGSAVAEVVAESGSGCRLVRLGIPDLFSIIGPPEELYHHHGYDADGIEATIRTLLTST